MQFIDLQMQYDALKHEIDQSIQNVLVRASFIMGQEVKELEQKLAEYVGVEHCVTCGNGTDALSLAMMAYGIKEGDAVFVPTFTFYASAETVSLAKATPIFVDIDKDTFNISPEDLEEAIKDVINQGKLKPRAIVAVDLFGLPFDVKRIKEIAERYNLLLIEDGAQGFGGAVKGKKACSLGDIATTSFFPAKPLGCYGDGGAIFTNEDKVRDYIESLRVHGKGKDKYDNVRVGLNSRLDTIQAAVLLPKLKAFENYELEARNKIAKYYNEMLAGIVKTPRIPSDYVSSYAQYSVLFDTRENRDLAETYLKMNNIPTMVYYRVCMHQQTVYKNNISIYRNFENAEYVSNRILNLPMHPYLKKEEIELICKGVKDAIIR